SASDRTDIASLRQGKVMPHRGEVILWDVRTGRQLRTLDGYSSVAFSQDGRLLAAAGLDGTVKVWEAATGKLVHACRGHAGRVVVVASGPDGKRLASANFDAVTDASRPARFRIELKTWDAETGREEATLLRTELMVTSVDFSPDGKLLACSLVDGSLK